MSSVFAKSEEGLAILIDASRCSAHWQEGSPEYVHKAYHGSNGTVGIGSIVHELRLCLPETAKELEKRWHIEGDALVQAAMQVEAEEEIASVVIGGRIDGDLMYSWISEWEAQYGHVTKKSDDWDDACRSAKTVKEKVCNYMNNWHVIITKSSGKPICIEEIRNENDRGVQFVSRDPTSLRAAYMKYTCAHKLLGSLPTCG